MKFTYTSEKNVAKVTLEKAATPFMRESKAGKELVVPVNAKDITRRKLILLTRKIIQVARQHKLEAIAVDFAVFDFPKLKKESKEELYSLIAQNMLLANYDYDKFKTAKNKKVKEVIAQNVTSKKLKDALKKGLTIAEAVNDARELSNTPGGDMTPTLLANLTKKLATGSKATVKVLGQKELEKEKMGAMLGVAKGSDEEPKLIVVEYWGAGKAKGKPTVIVGKGVTFDTGGLNVKPGDSMLGMHMDMSGGASAIMTTILAARLGLKKNVVTIVPAVENSPSGASYRPGDVLTSKAGITIDVLNTDAEGRIILADGLTYAERYEPETVLDIATLTGAVLIALGQYASAILTRNEKLQADLEKAGEASGDYVWPLPLWEEYEALTKGNNADVANIGTLGNSRYAGVINGATFLVPFAKKFKKWAHIDMASRMESAPNENLSKGSVGAGVQLMINYIENYS